MKIVLWALIGAFVAFGASELVEKFLPNSAISSVMGYKELAQYQKAFDEKEDMMKDLRKEFDSYRKSEGTNVEDTPEAFAEWQTSNSDPDVQALNTAYMDAYAKADELFYAAMENEFNGDGEKVVNVMYQIGRIHTAIWMGVIALFLGLFLGIGVGRSDDSKNVVESAAIAACVSFIVGILAGYLSDIMYANMVGEETSAFGVALIQAMGWAIMGLGVGLGVGLGKPKLKRIILCAVGGLLGAFVGGLLTKFLGDAISNMVVARGISIVITGVLIAIGVVLCGQFAGETETSKENA
ncbi:MAG: hypothetical protein K6G07_00280 [Lachnospiraceae bacterium]|nr:hypothetical protein [Lachnospiraceae bacterium]